MVAAWHHLEQTVSIKNKRHAANASGMGMLKLFGIIVIGTRRSALSAMLRARRANGAACRWRQTATNIGTLYQHHHNMGASCASAARFAFGCA